MSGAVQDALAETARLSHRIHPATLETGDLAALIRSAATAADISATVEVSASGSYAPGVLMTVHLCWLDTLARAGRGSEATIEVRDELDALAFEIRGAGTGSRVELERLRERVDALGGQLTVTSIGDRAVVACSLPAGR
jgi:signal transduction histidine kinase